MRKRPVFDLTVAAVIAALYAVLGYFGSVFSLTFGPVQIRFAEALTVLPFLFPAAAPGLAIGCLITNLVSPYGVLDMAVGTLATALAAWMTARVKKPWLAALPPVVCNLLLLPPMWAWAQVNAVNSAFFAAWGFNALTFLPGQIVACWGLGSLLLKYLPKIKPLRELMPPTRRT